MRAVVFAYHNMGIAGIRALLDHGFTIPMVLLGTGVFRIFEVAKRRFRL